MVDFSRQLLYMEIRNTEISKFLPGLLGTEGKPCNIQRRIRTTGQQSVTKPRMTYGIWKVD